MPCSLKYAPLDDPGAHQHTAPRGAAPGTALSSAIVGGALSRSSQRGVLRGAARQLMVLTAAAGVTFALGRLVGTSLA